MQIKPALSLVVSLAFAFGSAAAFAQSADAPLGKSGKPLTAQQLRMKNCNAEAKSQSLKGEERKAFMSTCLRGGKAVASNDAEKASPSLAQIKRKACNDDAKSQGLKGDARKDFVRSCVREDRLSHAE